MTRTLAASRSTAEQAQTPVRVGVTGHRFLVDEDRIAARVDGVLLRIQQVFASRPISVISSLAAGADQLVAWRALLLPEARLVACLPMPAAEYADDFAPTDRQQFFSLLHRAAEVVTLPPAGTRVDAYLAAGVQVVKGSDVLIAIWDGLPARGRGGTAEIVALARDRALPLVWIRAANGAPGARTLPQSMNSTPVRFERFPKERKEP